MSKFATAGGVESTAALASYNDTAGAYMDYDGATYAQVGAKGPGSLGVKIRTLLAGVAMTALTFASAGNAMTLGNGGGAAYGISGTTVANVADTASGAITFNAHVGRGTGAVGGFVFAVPVTTASGVTAQTLVNALVIKGTTNPAVYASGTETLHSALVSTSAVFYGPRAIFAIAAAAGPSLSVLRVNGTFAAPTAITNGDQLGAYTFQGSTATPTRITGAQLIATATEAWVAGTNTGTKLAFNVTVNGTTGSVTALTLDQDKSATFASNITQSAGSAALQALTATTGLFSNAVNITTSAVGTLLVLDAGGTNYNAIRFNQGGASKGFLGPDYGNAITNTSTNGDLVLRTDGSNLRFSFSATTMATMTGAGSFTTASSIKAVGDGFNANGVGLATDGSGLIDVGRTYASGTITFQRFVQIGVNVVGSVTFNGTNVAYNTTSDARLKVDRGVASDVSVLRALIVHEFDWRSSGVSDRGLFAQEARTVKPSAVFVGSNKLNDAGQPMNPWAVDYSKFVPDLIVGWQNHESRLSRIEKQLQLD